MMIKSIAFLTIFHQAAPIDLPEVQWIGKSLLISFFLKVNPTMTNSKTTDGSEAGFKLSSVYNKLDNGKKRWVQ
jgi:hypothetical protein